jgi:hypothetical protein
LKALHERVLQDVLGQRTVAETALQEAEKLPVVIDELLCQVWIHRWFGCEV